jgi:hypothetical protein
MSLTHEPIIVVSATDVAPKNISKCLNLKESISNNIQRTVTVATCHTFLKMLSSVIIVSKICNCRSQWPCGLRRGSTAARLLGLWVRIPPRAWISLSCECCVMSGRGLCDELVPRRGVLPSVVCLMCVIVKSRTMKRPRPPKGLSSH